jgi:predicted neutral ceramidase superfamily lipid hydrolase
MNQNHDMELRLIEIIDICYITLLFVSFAYIIAKILDKLFDKIFGKIHIKKKYSQFRIFSEIVIQLIITCIMAYLARNLIQSIPFPLNNYYGFDHLKVKEVNSGAVLNMFLVAFQSNLQNKLKYIRDNYS